LSLHVFGQEPIMVQVFIVGAGGFLGSVLRYWTSGIVQRWVQDAFPLGTLAVNFVGCLAIGLVWGLVEYRQWLSPEVRSFVTFGILGGFTTFSAFGFETFELLRSGRYWLALINVAANVMLGLAAVLIGWTASKALPV
jgi:CrcB protein